MLKKRRYLVGGFVILVALGFLLFNVFQGYSLYYYTIGELKEQGESIYGEQVRVTGEVAEGSIEYDVENRILTFTISDEEESLPMLYEGIPPNNFDDGVEVVVEGSYNSTGVFEADQIITKCPSRYVPAE